MVFYLKAAAAVAEGDEDDLETGVEELTGPSRIDLNIKKLNV